MIKKINFFFILRIFVSLIFIVSGLEKALGPYQNFLYVVQEYSILPPPLEGMVAHIFPWIELFIGFFLLLGLWIRFSLIGVLAMVSTFIVIVSQALIRKLPIVDCGCFGELISFKLHHVLVMDSCLFLITCLLLSQLSKVSVVSLDQYFKSS